MSPSAAGLPASQGMLLTGMHFDLETCFMSFHSVISKVCLCSCDTCETVCMFCIAACSDTHLCCDLTRESSSSFLLLPPSCDCRRLLVRETFPVLLLLLCLYHILGSKYKLNLMAVIRLLLPSHTQPSLPSHAFALTHRSFPHLHPLFPSSIMNTNQWGDHDDDDDGGGWDGRKREGKRKGRRWTKLQTFSPSWLSGKRSLSESEKKLVIAPSDLRTQTEALLKTTLDPIDMFARLWIFQKAHTHTQSQLLQASSDQESQKIKPGAASHSDFLFYHLLQAPHILSLSLSFRRPFPNQRPVDLNLIKRPFHPVIISQLALHELTHWLTYDPDLCEWV